jgi:hypothetical protein
MMDVSATRRGERRGAAGLEYSSVPEAVDWSGARLGTTLFTQPNPQRLPHFHGIASMLVSMARPSPTTAPHFSKRMVSYKVPLLIRAGCLPAAVREGDILVGPLWRAYVVGSCTPAVVPRSREASAFSLPTPPRSSLKQPEP